MPYYAAALNMFVVIFGASFLVCVCVSRIPTARVNQLARASCLAPATFNCGSSGGLLPRCKSSRRGEHQLGSRPLNHRAPSACYCRPWLQRAGKKGSARAPQQQRHYQIQLIYRKAMATLLRYLLLVRHDMMIYLQRCCVYKTNCVKRCSVKSE